MVGSAFSFLSVVLFTMAQAALPVYGLLSGMFSSLIQATEPLPGFLDQLPGLGVGGILAAGMFWAFQNAEKAHHKRETELLEQRAAVQLASEQRATKAEADARADVTQLLVRAIEVQDRSNQASTAMSTALTELTGAVKSIADVRELGDRIAGLEKKLRVPPTK